MTFMLAALNIVCHYNKRMKVLHKSIILATLTFFCFNTNGQSSDQLKAFEKDFNVVADIFDKNLEPYLRKFAQGLTSPTMDSCDRIKYPQSVYNLLKIKTDRVRKDLYSEFLNICSKAKSPCSKEKMLNNFSTVYMMEIPGLDYRFFEQCEREVEAFLKEEKKKE